MAASHGIAGRQASQERLEFSGLQQCVSFWPVTKRGNFCKVGRFISRQRAAMLGRIFFL
jgi:hypothetical protein